VNSFAFARPKSFAEAANLLAERGRYSLPVLKAGGMDIVDHLKEGLFAPDLLIDVKRLRSNGAAESVRIANGEIHVEASATLAEIASNGAIRQSAPVLAQCVEGAATPQVRNVASAAGNLLQRPRCWYYRHAQFHCLKKGGDRCYAVEGENKFHAIFGGGPCHIVHPSNLALGLMVTDGVVHILGGERDSVSIGDLFHLPANGVTSEHNLTATEVVTHITATSAPHSGFYAVKEKQSFDWPLVAAAVALELDGMTIRSAKVCAGAVAPVPWRLTNVEEALAGVSPDDDGALRAACAKAGEGARPMSENAYKVKLLPVAVRRAVLIAAGRGQKEWA
jgi:xanthine dehydrogenase YagS FAD-binding subunit